MKIEEKQQTMKPVIEYYNPRETMSFSQVHAVEIHFQYENAHAHIITTMGGNVLGGSILESFTDLYTGLTAPRNHPLNIKHAQFEESDPPLKNGEVELIKFYYPDNSTYEMDPEEASDYIVGVRLIDYDPHDSDNE